MDFLQLRALSQRLLLQLCLLNWAAVKELKFSCDNKGNTGSLYRIYRVYRDMYIYIYIYMA